MNFSENTNLRPGGQSASPSKVRELENKIDDLAQTVTSVADSVADLADEVTTAELNATDANVTNAVIDNATVGTETATTVNADTVNADNLNATDADITNLTADDVEANSVDADNGYFGSVNAQSFTGQNVNVSEDVTASNKVQGKTVQATEKVVTPALESTTTELKGATTVRGDVYFPETGDKIYGEYLEVDANKVDADTVKVNSLTTETPTGSSQLVGYDANGKLIPVDAGFDPSNYWEQVPNSNPDPDIARFIRPKDNKFVQAPAVVAEYIAGMTKIESPLVGGTTVRAVESLTVDEGGETILRDTEVDGDLTVNGDIIQNGSAYETHAEKVYSKKDLIITRDGAVSGLSTGQYTGIQAEKYDGTNDGQLVFDKDGEARVGDVGDTEPLMTRDELADMTNGSLLKWDGTNKKAVCAQSADIIPSDASTSNKLATKDYVSAALVNINSFIDSVRVDIVNDTSSDKIIFLGVMETDNYGRAGINLDITFRRVDTTGRIFATLKADEVASKYLNITPDYKPIAIKKTRITDGKKYNVYLRIESYTPLTRVIINAPLNFTVRNVEVTELEGTEITCTAVGINDL